MKNKRKNHLHHRLHAKQLLALLLCLVLLSSAAPAVAAADNRTAKAGVFYFDGYHMRGDDGSYTGYGIELLGLISRYSHLNFEFTGYYNTWAETQSMLLDGEIDVATSARKTPERMELFLFSLPLALNNTILSVREDNTSLVSGEYGTYDGMTVGLLAGNSQNQLLGEFARKNGFTYQTREYGSNRQLEAALQSGEIDAILTSNLRRAEKETLLDTVQVDYFYAITRKDDRELMDELNRAITQMELYESGWSDVLFDKYYGTGAADYSNEFTQEELDYMQAVASGHKSITVTAMPGRRPYSYVEDGQLKGIVPQYFDRLMQANGLPYEVLVPEDADEYNRLLDSGGVDVVLDWQRSAAGDSGYTQGGFLTDIYMETGTALVKRADTGDTPTFLAVTETDRELPLECVQFRDVRIQTWPDEEDVLQAVLDGRADAAFMHTYAAQFFVNYDSTNALRLSPVDSQQVVFRMYVPDSSDHELANILNKCIRQTPGDVLTQLIAESTAVTAENLTIRQYLSAHPWLVIMLSTLAAVAAGVIVYLFARSRWNNKLLRATEQSRQELEEQLAITDALSLDLSAIYALNLQTENARAIRLDDEYMPSGLDWESGETFSYTASLHRYIDSWVLDEDKDRLKEALSPERLRKEAADGKQYTGNYRAEIDGEVRNYQFVCVAYRTEGQIISHALIGFRNIDEIVRREQKQNEALKDALQMAKAASEAKTAFLSSVSHDIRTPMNAIIGFLTLMQDETDNPTAVRKYIRRIDDASKHLLSLINDVLDMSKIESGSTTLSLAEMDLAEVITEINTFIQPQTRAKNQSFEIFASHLKHEHLVADKMRINQILINLLSNSVKYTPEGGSIEMRVDELPQVVKNYSRIRFTVRDNGMGMSEDYLKVIFEPFTRADTQATREIQGTGLGMPITKRLVELMGGTVSVESKLGEGSTFVIELELEIREKESDPEFWAEHRIKRLLVVDDDEELCRNVVKAMDAAGVAAGFATDGERAVRMVRQAEKPYDLLLLDWKMPGMSGLEAARLIREHSKIPIILLTAYDWKEIEQEAAELGLTHFMPKPFFMSTFKEAVRLMTERANESRQQESDVVRGMRILVVDDIEVNRIILVKILGALGAECDTAVNGREAVEKFTDAPSGFDLILMDVQMPEMNGYEATRAIRASGHPLASTIPIIAMTANAFVDDVRDAINSGMDAHIAKPVQIDNLKSTIRQVLDSRGSPAD